MKLLYFDTETTGTDPVKHDIIQLSGLIEIDGVVKEEFNFRCQPFNFETIEPGALLVNHITVDQLKEYPNPRKVYLEFISILSKYVNKFDKNDKFTPAGYNVAFDIQFVAEWFKKNGDNYWGSWQNWAGIDALPIVRFLMYSGAMKLTDNHKLTTICECLEIKIDAHDALNDIKATREVINCLKKYLVKI